MILTTMIGATVGVLLNQFSNVTQRAIERAEEAGCRIAVEAGVQLRQTIENVKIAYFESLDKTMDRVDITVQNALGTLRQLVDDVQSRNEQTLLSLASRTQQIANTLPLHNERPQLTEVKGRFIFKKFGDKTSARFRFLGNFQHASEQRHQPKLTFYGRTFTPCEITTQALEFSVSLDDIFPLNIFPISQQKINELNQQVNQAQIYLNNNPMPFQVSNDDGMGFSGLCGLMDGLLRVATSSHKATLAMQLMSSPRIVYSEGTLTTSWPGGFLGARKEAIFRISPALLPSSVGKITVHRDIKKREERPFLSQRLDACFSYVQAYPNKGWRVVQGTQKISKLAIAIIDLPPLSSFKGSLTDYVGIYTRIVQGREVDTSPLPTFCGGGEESAMFQTGRLFGFEKFSISFMEYREVSIVTSEEIHLQWGESEIFSAPGTWRITFDDVKGKHHELGGVGKTDIIRVDKEMGNQYKISAISPSEFDPN
ncbi:MAG: hypothetical protein JSR80_00630 [Verrucomicrobia bacterium]|nr:hypothetical protein [Verrucomicrobiota bacterium]